MPSEIEKLISKWVEESAAQDLPGKGQPIDLDEYFKWPEDLRLGYSLIKNAGFVPPEIESLQNMEQLRVQIEACADSGSRLRLERRLREEEAQFNFRMEQRKRSRKL